VSYLGTWGQRELAAREAIHALAGAFSAPRTKLRFLLAGRRPSVASLREVPAY